MDYTSYGLVEGLFNLVPVFVIITLVYLFRLKTSKNDKDLKYLLTIMYISVMTSFILDTIWWIFSIETNIIDFKIKVNGNVEQVTLFMVIGFLSLLVLIFEKRGISKS